MKPIIRTLAFFAKNLTSINDEINKLRLIFLFDVVRDMCLDVELCLINKKRRETTVLMLSQNTSATAAYRLATMT